MTEQIQKYAAVLWRPEDIIEIRIFPPREEGKGGPPEQKWAKAAGILSLFPWMQERNQQHYGIYAGVLPRGKDGGSKDEDVVTGRVLWADIDHTEPRAGWLKAKACGMPEPTMTVASGHGVHLFWVLSHLEPAFTIRDTVGALAEMLGSDTSVKNPSRILRVPGFQNWKPPAAPAKLLHVSETIYEFSDLRGKIRAPQSSPAPAGPANHGGPIIERARKYVAMMPGKTSGGRTSQAFHVAGVLCRDYGLSHDEALPILEGWDKAANQPPIKGDPAYPDDELSKIINNVLRYGKKPVGCKDRPSESVPRIDVSGTADKDVEGMIEDVENQAAGKNVTTPLPWNLLHEQTKMLRPGSVFLVAGPMKTGKTFFILNIVLHAAEVGLPWRYLVLEDTRKLFGWRVLAAAENDYRMIDDDPATTEIRREALMTRADYLNAVLDRVTENPRVGKKDGQGNVIIPKVPMDSVLCWIKDSLRDSKLTIVDPVSQIEFDHRNQFQEEADFIRHCLGYAAAANGIVGLVMHTVKRPGVHGTLKLSAEDIQGSAMFGRLAHTSLLIDAHDPIDSDVRAFGGLTREVNHNRTIIIGAARNAGGTRKSIAFNQGSTGPVFEEMGVLMPKKPGRKTK